MHANSIPDPVCSSGGRSVGDLAGARRPRDAIERSPCLALVVADHLLGRADDRAEALARRPESRPISRSRAARLRLG